MRTSIIGEFRSAISFFLGSRREKFLKTSTIGKLMFSVRGLYKRRKRQHMLGEDEEEEKE